MSENISVDVSNASEAEDIPTPEVISYWVRAAIARVVGEESIEVSVRIVGEDEGRQLNERFRDKSGATNVLSFPAGDPPAEIPAGTPRMLGDIVVCAPVVEREAAEQEKAPAAHWAHMIVHGSLHLLGYDHLDDSEAETMETYEKQILAEGGIDDPYAP
jgi:probable rRNA maturation factor